MVVVDPHGGIGTATGRRSADHDRAAFGDWLRW
jgi:hypothetical protein